MVELLQEHDFRFLCKAVGPPCMLSKLYYDLAQLTQAYVRKTLGC